MLKFLYIVLLIVIRLSQTHSKLGRNDFPHPFVFGSGTSAYQVEGAAAEDGRTPSIWDTDVHAGEATDGSTGDVACDEYHKYKEDVKLMVETGLEAYRFSISWSRLIPRGRGPVNPKGLEFYNNLINELISHGIQPHITLYHYDLPQVLEDEYGGWRSPKIVKDFTEYANVCFREFGDRVLHWTTLNEPNVFSFGGYDLAILPPRRCSYPYGHGCSGGNSSVEPYIVAHNCILAHASVASLYRKKYQAKQHGFIGLNVFVYWFSPLTNSTEDVIATQRAHDFLSGWFVNPLVFGDYPDTMRERAGSKLPTFSRYQSSKIIGSFDFFGINHYSTMYVQDKQNNLDVGRRDFFSDMAAELSMQWHGKPEGKFPIEPYGMQAVLEHFKNVYGNPPIYIHENGYPLPSNESLNDARRITYLKGFIESLHNAIRNGSKARGYFTWSFLDAYELFDGYRSRYGLYRVDFHSEDLKRQPKLSALWYSNFLRGKGVIDKRIPTSDLVSVDLF